MKRSIRIYMVLCICLILLAGCSSTPDGMSDEAYDYGLKILETVDQYLDADIDEDEAYDKIDALKERIDSLDSGEHEDLILGTKATTLQLSLNEAKRDAFGSNALEDIRAQRDELAEQLGK